RRPGPAQASHAAGPRQHGGELPRDHLSHLHHGGEARPARPARPRAGTHPRAPRFSPGTLGGVATSGHLASPGSARRYAAPPPPSPPRLSNTRGRSIRVDLEGFVPRVLNLTFASVLNLALPS